MIQQVYTVKELSKALRLSEWTVRRLIRENKLSKLKGTSRFLVSQKALDDYLNEPAEVK